MAKLSYIILENGVPMDGEIYSLERLMKAIPYADYDARIVAWDAPELGRDLATSLRDVTDDVVSDWWDKNDGASETYSLIEAGREAPALALKYYSDQCALHTDFVEQAA